MASDYEQLHCTYFGPMPTVGKGGIIVAPIPDGRIGTFDEHGMLISARPMTRDDIRIDPPLDAETFGGDPGPEIGKGTGRVPMTTHPVPDELAALFDPDTWPDERE